MATVQANASDNLGTARRVTLRRQGDESSYDLGPTARDLLNAFELTINDKKSHALLMWPQSVRGISVVHALAALTRLSNCDTKRLTTVLFPWNRNAGATQKSLLVDREQLVVAARIPLDRIHLLRPPHPSFGYLLALLSLKHLDAGHQGNRRYSAVERDPSLLYPTLFEIMPQTGIETSESAN